MHTIREKGRGGFMKLTRDEHLYFNACAKALLACPDVQSMSAFTQHGRVSCLEHSLSVAYYSYWLCRRLRLRRALRP